MLDILASIVVGVIQGFLIVIALAILYGIYANYIKKPDTTRVEREDRLLAWADKMGIGNMDNFKSDLAGHRIYCGIPRDKDKMHIMTQLDLSGCSDPRELVTPPLDSLPSEISVLDNLLSINVSINALESLPDEIGEFKYLIELNLFANKLRELPPTLFNLKRLETLILAVNHFESLPSDIEKLQKLRYLYLNDNNLKTLPEEITHLKKLLFLDICGNPNLELNHAQLVWLSKGVQLRCDKEQAKKFGIHFEEQK